MSSPVKYVYAFGASLTEGEAAMKNLLGGKEGMEAQGPFPFKTRSTQVLFVQQVMQSLAPGGVCGIVLDEGDWWDLGSRAEYLAVHAALAARESAAAAKAQLEQAEQQLKASTARLAAGVATKSVSSTILPTWQLTRKAQCQRSLLRGFQNPYFNPLQFWIIWNMPTQSRH